MKKQLLSVAKLRVLLPSSPGGISATSYRIGSTLNADNPYASAAQTAALLRSGVQYRRDRMEAADMITTIEAAVLAGRRRVTINAWIKKWALRRCVQPAPRLQAAALAG